MGVFGKNNGLSPASAKNGNGVGQDAEIAFDLDGAGDASPAFRAAARRRRLSLPSGWFATELLGRSRRRTRANASAGRPPRHPKSKVSKKCEEANAPASYRRDLDVFINEKYPTTEVRDVVEKARFNDEAEIEFLTNDSFRSLLGVELLGLEEADDVSVVLSGPRKHERGSALRFQCLDVWD